MQKIIFITLLLCGALKASDLLEVLTYSARPIKPSKYNALETQPRQSRPFKVVYEQGTKKYYFNLYVEGDFCLSGSILRKDNYFIPLNLSYIVGSLRLIIENLHPKTASALHKILNRGWSAIGSSEMDENDATEKLLNDWLDSQKDLIEHEIIAAVAKKFEHDNRIKYMDPRFSK